MTDREKAAFLAGLAASDFEIACVLAERLGLTDAVLAAVTNEISAELHDLAPSLKALLKGFVQ